MPTDHRYYPTVPRNVAPDVPYYVNLGLDAVDLDVNDLATKTTAGITKAQATADAAVQSAADSATSSAASATSSAASAQEAGTIRDNLETRLGAVETAAGYAPGDATDAAMTNIALQPDTEFSAALNSKTADAVAVRTDRGFMSLQLAVDACQPGDTLQIRQSWATSTPAVVDKSLTLKSVRGGSVLTMGNHHAFTVTADGVTFDDVTIAGFGSTAAGAQAAIHAKGTLAAPIRGLKVRNCQITGFSKYGIEGHHIHDFDFERNTIDGVSYGGIMVLSGKGGQITYNTIRNVTQPGVFVNSYGIGLTRDSTSPMSTHPRTTDVIVTYNLVDGVPGWEGIDTHAGENLTISGNTVLNCNVGIALVPCPNEVGQDTWAPRGIKVTGNTIDSTVTDGSRSFGIQVVGASDGVEIVVEYATAIVRGNTITGHGKQGTSASGGIQLSVTEGAIVQGNILEAPAPNGIYCYQNNKAALVLDNTVIDAWTNTLVFTSVIYAQSSHQTLTLRGNTAVRGAKTATLVHARGLFGPSSAIQPTVSIRYESNDFTLCTAPITNGGATKFVQDATNLSFTAGKEPKPTRTIRPNGTDALTTQLLVNDLADLAREIGLAK